MPKHDREPVRASRSPNGDWYPAALPARTSVLSQLLFTSDGAATRGTLYHIPGASSVVAIMHPRSDASRHYLIPALLEAGFSVWTQLGRSGSGDLQLVHELALLDIATGMEFLRERGYDNVICLGNSGGASLYSFYIDQATRRPDDRILVTPGGRASGLEHALMPDVDGVVYVAPHPGQGALLLECIDPSVVDEQDPLSVQPELDLFNPDNGFVSAPDSSSYSAHFLARYRSAQRERVARIDAYARECIEGRRAARARFERHGQLDDQRAATYLPVVNVARTDADPRTVDLSLDPSDRGYGSVFGHRPHVTNYGLIGFGRMTTPEAWLSTWSGLSSNAQLARTAASIRCPALVVQYTGDKCVFPSQTARIAADLGSADKTNVQVSADHFGKPIGSGVPHEDAAPLIQQWLQARFG